jgi:hypothetical protein
MRITFTFQAVVTRKKSDKTALAPDAMNGWKPEECRMDRYLDPDLADAGFIGGEFRVLVLNGQARLEVTYWVAAETNKKLIARLKKDTIGQLEDGIGEAGFEYNSGGNKLIVKANTAESATVTVVEDGRDIPTPSKTAIAARDGDIASLITAIKADPDEIDKLHQEFSALQYAVLNGHMEASRLLLAAGADANKLDSDGTSLLEMCALSNAIEDEESRKIAQMLLNAGANPSHVTPDGESAKSYAEARGKIRMAEIL